MEGLTARTIGMQWLFLHWKQLYGAVKIYDQTYRIYIETAGSGIKILWDHTQFYFLTKWMNEYSRLLPYIIQQLHIGRSRQKIK